MFKVVLLLMYKLCIVIWFVCLEVRNKIVFVILEGFVSFCSGIFVLYVLSEFLMMFFVLFLFCYIVCCILVFVELGDMMLQWI